jgi:undecaprenol kinase
MMLLSHVSALFHSFGFALKGWRIALHERNMLVHVLAVVVVVSAGFYFQVSAGEWLALIIVMGMVLMAELFNTALEVLCGAVTSEWREDIGRVKDLSSGAVLIAAVTAIVVGVVVFGGKIY